MKNTNSNKENQRWNMSSFTKEAIKASFIKLLNKKPLAKITVKEIVEDCKINRNSFYYHYSDIPSLLEEILLEEADRFLNERDCNCSLYDSLTAAIDFAVQNKTAILHIYNSSNQQMLYRYFNRVSYITVSEFINTLDGTQNIADGDRQAIVMYYKCQLVGFVIDWLAGGMKYDLCDKIKRICELFDGSMEKAIERCAKKQD